MLTTAVGGTEVAGYQVGMLTTDDTGLLVLEDPLGIIFTDAANPAALSSATPWFSFPRPADPTQNAGNVPTSVVLQVGNFSTPASVFFGTEPATNVSFSGTLKATAPSGTQTGLVNVMAYFSDGWAALAPDAFSYGPTIRSITPTVVDSPGGNVIEILGTGFNLDKNLIQVTIGGKPATITSSSVEHVSSGALLLYRLLVVAPPGTPGPAVVTLSTPTGTATAKGFRYTRAIKVIPFQGTIEQMIYDRVRKRVYLVNSLLDRIDVFSAETELFLNSVPVGDVPTSITMTPNGATLLVTSLGAGTISVIDANSLTLQHVIPATDPFDTYANPKPVSIAATSLGKAFVTLQRDGSGCRDQALEELDLQSLTFRARTFPFGQCQADWDRLTVNEDGTRVLLTSYGSLWFWNATTDTFSYYRGPSGDFYVDTAISDDGDRMFGFHYYSGPHLYDSQFIRRSDIRWSRYVSRSYSFDAKFHVAGNLLYLPQGFTLDVVDTNTGTVLRRIALPEPQTGAFAIDDLGQKLFMKTTSGMTVVDLDSVPLGIGSLTPPVGSPTGTNGVTVRGSGFASTSTVSVEGTSVATTFLDSNTLRIDVPELPAGSKRVTVSNSDGETYTLANAFSVFAEAPAPQLASSTPASAWTRSVDYEIFINGRNFVPGSILRWNGHDRPTRFINRFQLAALLLAVWPFPTFHSTSTILSRQMTAVGRWNRVKHAPCQFIFVLSPRDFGVVR